MSLLAGDPRGGGLRQSLLLVLSAAGAALVLRLAWDYPLAALVGLLGMLLALGARWQSRRRASDVLRSGDVERVLSQWRTGLERVPHAETMAPLMMATALAAYGWLERARHVLRTARRGPVWESAVEHRLFVEALLLIFEGRSEQARERASALERLPVPTALPWLAKRIRTLRSAMGALARAFAHQGRVGDRRLMLQAGEASPLVFWAMRYGAAIVAIDDGDPDQARRLLRDAPAWPDESCFRDFHREILDELQRVVSASAVAEPGPTSDGSDAPTT
ncbi:MAG: hypothetical protein JRI23_06820 [Deltaproteobacteria bacterium]|jgi:hypothetical protein|nr:hypothetical protein [Deltaproteobacteria bacterium]MBW2531299.1 hypothetical protein [Deltaproteobacteria bacterium]